MVRSLIFVFSLVSCVVASLWVMPRLVDQTHLQKALALAVGSEFEIGQESRLRILPSPRIEVIGLKLKHASNPENELGMVSADYVALNYGWTSLTPRKLLIEGAIFELKASPNQAEALIQTLQNRVLDLEIEDSDIARKAAEGGLRLVHIEFLRWQKSNDLSQSFDASLYQYEPYETGIPFKTGPLIAVTGTAKPLRELGGAKLLSFDATVEKGYPGEETAQAVVDGSLQFGDAKGLRLSSLIEFTSLDAALDLPIAGKGALSWDQNGLLLDDLRLQIKDKELRGNFILDAGENPALTLSGQTLTNLVPIDSKTSARSYTNQLAGLLQGFLAENALFDAEAFQVSLALNSLNLPQLSLANISAQFLVQPKGIVIQTLAFDTEGSTRFEGQNGYISETLELRGSVRSNRPTTFLNKFGLQGSDPRLASSIPPLEAEGSLTLFEDGVRLSLNQVKIAGDTFKLNYRKDLGAQHKIEILRASETSGLNADYLNQDLAPTDGALTDPVGWLEQHLAQLPDFDLTTDLERLTIGTLNFGRINAVLNWADNRLQFAGIERPALDGAKTVNVSGTHTRISDLEGTEISAQGTLVFDDVSQELLQLTGFESFSLNAKPLNHKASPALFSSLSQNLSAGIESGLGLSLVPSKRVKAITNLSVNAKSLSKTAVKAGVLIKTGAETGVSILADLALDHGQSQDLHRNWHLQKAQWETAYSTISADQILGKALGRYAPLSVTRTNGQLEVQSRQAVRRATLNSSRGDRIDLQSGLSLPRRLNSASAATNQPVRHAITYAINGQNAQGLAFDLNGDLLIDKGALETRLTSQTLSVDGQDLHLDLQIPTNSGITTGRLSMPVLQANSKVLDLSIAALEGLDFAIDLEIGTADLGGLSTTNLRATALSQGNSLQLLGLETDVEQLSFSGEASLVYGLLPRLKLDLKSQRFERLFDLQGSALAYAGSLDLNLEATGISATAMRDSVNLTATPIGQAALTVKTQDQILPNWQNRLDAMIGLEARQQLQGLFFQALANTALDIKGKIRFAEGLLRGSDLKLTFDQTEARISGRWDLVNDNLDLDIALHQNDPLIPDAALEISGSAIAPTLRAFGSRLRLP